MVDPDGVERARPQRAAPIVRADPTSSPSGRRADRARRPDRPLGGGGARRPRSRSRCIDEGSGSPGDAPEPRAPPAPGVTRPTASTVFAASSMPVSDLESFLPPARQLRFLSNRGANGIDGLVSSGLGAAAAGGRRRMSLGDLGLHHDMAASRRCAGSSPRCGRRHQQRRRRDLPLPATGGRRWAAGEFEALLGTPAGVEIERLAALHEIRYERVEELSQLGAIAGGHAILELRTDRRRNVELHRRLTESATAAVESVGERR